MEKYFEKFQIISYSNTAVRDITQRTAVLNSVYNDPMLYYPYDLMQGERPDILANRYYGDQYMSWILYLSNRVIDPYHDWYLDQATFDDFVIKKYGSLANALTKVKYYRNNWYSDPNPTISASAYNSLLPELKKFYEPEEENGIVTSSPRFYVRRREDWKIETNAMARYEVSTEPAFIVDEVIDVRFGPTEVGTGQMVFAGPDSVVIKNLDGITVNGTVSGSSRLVGRQSGVSVAFTAPELLVNNIPAGESSYWSPVTYYEYENEINERNKSVLVLRNEYASKASKQLRDLLK